MSRRLSKSRFQKGLQCEKGLWLAMHRPELAAPVDESKQWIFDQGTEMGRLAQQLFVGGVEVTEDHFETEKALETTARLLAEQPRPLFEPAFFFDGVLVRVDALVPVGDGTWDLFEVKSSGRVKDEHVTDAAVQTYVVEGAGVPVRRSHIVHVNTGYVWPGGEYDLRQLFVIADITDEVRAFMPEVAPALVRLRAMLDGPEPDVRIGQQCSKPYGCDFAGYCHAFLPEKHPITDLPRLSERALHALLDQGVTSIRDIPPLYAELSKAQERVADAVRRDEPWVDLTGLAHSLSRLTWPVYHLDFETVMAALPLWPGTHPYQAIPFQYSIHVHHEDGRHEHRDYLHTSGGDPREPLAERLVTDLDGEGSVLHYSPYERRVLRELASAAPHLAPQLEAVIDRLFDLAPVVSNHAVHPDAAGRTSIKYVLPAWCPDVSYADLEIGDGQTASIRYLMAVTGRLGEEEAAEVFEHLRAYCGMDTLAMVRLLDALREVARA